jgi:hypothetical protein
VKEEKKPQPTNDFERSFSGFGVPFSSSRARKSPIFVSESKKVGWKSLRTAKVNSKKLGKLPYSGCKIPYTHEGSEGSMYFLSTKDFKEVSGSIQIL